jgi:hypothetical protein
MAVPIHTFQMAFNAEDNWDFPVADVVAAKVAIVSDQAMQHQWKQIRGRFYKQPSSNKRYGHFEYSCSLLGSRPPPPTPPAYPLPLDPPKYQGLGKLICLPLVTAVLTVGSYLE